VNNENDIVKMISVNGLPCGF